MHDLSRKLMSVGWREDPTETGKWRKITDPRPEFQKQFQTDRLGKVQDNAFYVTVGALGITARTLMNRYRLPILELNTTSGRQKDAYPGFDLNSCPAEALEFFLEGLRAAVDSHLALDSAKS